MSSVFQSTQVKSNQYQSLPLVFVVHHCCDETQTTWISSNSTRFLAHVFVVHHCCGETDNLAPKIIPFFCHVSALLLVFPTLFSPASTPASPAAPKHFPSVALSPFQLSFSLLSLKGRSSDNVVSLCTLNLILLLSVTILSFLAASLMAVGFMCQLYVSAHLSQLYVLSRPSQ